MVARLAFCVLVVLSAATCGTCGSSSVSSTNHCVETRLCLTISGPLAGTTGRLLADPDCIAETYLQMHRQHLCGEAGLRHDPGAADIGQSAGVAGLVVVDGAGQRHQDGRAADHGEFGDGSARKT